MIDEIQIRPDSPSNDPNLNRVSSAKSDRAGATYADGFEDELEDSEAGKLADVDIITYAKVTGTTPQAVWDDLRAGKLLGRVFEGQVLVCNPQTSHVDIGKNQVFNFSALPPLPKSGSQNMLVPQAKNEAAATSTEVALLIDHLSIAKEENREIIRLTQDAMQRMESLHQKVLDTKDQIIEDRNQEIALMRTELAMLKEKVQLLQKEKEDFETLTRVL